MHAGSAADREAFLLPGAETPLLTAMEGGERLAVCLAFGEFRGGGIKDRLDFKYHVPWK